MSERVPDFRQCTQQTLVRDLQQLARCVKALQGTVSDGKDGADGDDGKDGENGATWTGKTVSVTSGSTTALTVEPPQTITVLVPYCSSTTVISLPAPEEGMFCIVLIRLESSALPTANNIYFKDDLGTTIGSAVGNSPSINYYSYFCYAFDNNGTIKWDAYLEHSWSV